MGTQLADGLSDGPQQFVVGMGLEATLVGERQHLVIHACGVADSQYGDTAVHKLFGYPVNGHVRLRTHQYLVLAAQRLVDGLDECRRLARARRTVDNGHVLGPEHAVDGFLLRAVQIREV